MTGSILSAVGRRAFFGAILLVATLPLGYAPRRGLVTVKAYCQDGTCCPEDGAFCVVGDNQVKNYYFKASGSCKQPPPDM